MAKFVISGCSFTMTSLPTKEPKYILDPSLYASQWWVNKYPEGPNVQYFIKSKNNEVVDMSWRGSSNESILRRVYEYIDFTKCTNTNFAVHLTYLHRVGIQLPHPYEWVDFQTVSPDNFRKQVYQHSYDIRYCSIGGITKSKYPYKVCTKPNQDILHKINNTFYKTYLEDIYDDINAQKELIYKIKLLKAYVESKQNKIIFIGFPSFSDNALNNLLIDIDNGNRSFLEYAQKNDMIAFEGHLNDKGHDALSEIIIEQFI